MAHHLSLFSGTSSTDASSGRAFSPSTRLTQPEEDDVIMFGNAPRTTMASSLVAPVHIHFAEAHTASVQFPNIRDVNDLLDAGMSTPRPASRADEADVEAAPRVSLDSIYSNSSNGSYERSAKRSDPFEYDDESSESSDDDPDRTPRASQLFKAVRALGPEGMPPVSRSTTAPPRSRGISTAPRICSASNVPPAHRRGMSTSPHLFADLPDAPIAYYSPRTAGPSHTRAVNTASPRGAPSAQPSTNNNTAYLGVPRAVRTSASAASLRTTKPSATRPNTTKPLPPLGTTTPEKFPPLPPVPAPHKLRSPTGSFAETRLKLQASKARLAPHPILERADAETDARSDGGAEALTARASSQVLPALMQSPTALTQPSKASYAALLRELDSICKNTNMPTEDKEQVMAMLEAVFEQVHAEGRACGIASVSGRDMPRTLSFEGDDGKAVRQRRRVSSMFSAVSEFPAFPPVAAQPVTAHIEEIEPETPSTPTTPITPTTATNDASKGRRLRRLFRKDKETKRDSGSSGETDHSATSTKVGTPTTETNPYAFTGPVAPDIPDLTPRTARPNLTIEVPAPPYLAVPAPLQSRWSETTADASDDGTWRAKAARFRGGLGFSWGRKDKGAAAASSAPAPPPPCSASDAQAQAVLEQALAKLTPPGKVRSDGTPIESSTGMPGDKDNSAMRGFLERALTKLRAPATPTAPTAWDAAGGSPSANVTAPASIHHLAPPSAAQLYRFRPASARKITTGDVGRPVPFTAEGTLSSLRMDAARDRETEQRDANTRRRFRSFGATRI